MEYRSLGRTGAQVSELCLGTMTFGPKTDVTEAARIVDRFIEAGGNFIDTANVYGGKDWSSTAGRGTSEEVLAAALSDGKRDRIFLATKAHGKMGEGPNDWGNTRVSLTKALEDSLRRLKTDYVDLYQIHRPQASVPIDETLRALDDFVNQGKVRYIGSSTFAAYQVVESLWVSERYSLNRFVTEQPPYNILDRRIERELIPAALTYGIGIIPWSPLAGGKLTGKYRKGETQPDNSREDPGSFSPRTWDVLEALEKHCRDKNVSLTAFSLAWNIKQKGVTAPIIGPKSVLQLDENLAAIDVEITDEDLKFVDSLVKPGEHTESYYNADFGPNNRW